MALPCMDYSLFAAGEVVKPVEGMSDPWSWMNPNPMVDRPYLGSNQVVEFEVVAGAR